MTFERIGTNNAGYPILERKKKASDTSPATPKISRRGFLKMAGGTAGAMAISTALLQKKEEGILEVAQIESETQSDYQDIEQQEEAEILPSSEAFEAQKEGFKRWWTLSFNEVQFLNADGSPSGEPIALEDVLIEDPVRPGQMQRISVGKKNDSGLIVGGIAGAWLTYHRDRLGLSIEKGEGKLMHNTAEFEKALQNTSEPELIRSIQDAAAGGNGIDSVADIARYFGMNSEKKVRGDSEGRTRAEYLQQEIMFHNKVPQVVQDELRRLIVGLAAQESRFNAGMKKNSATAEGILQLTDDVRNEHGYDPKQRLSFMQEVDVAGKHFSNIYTRVRYWMKNHRIEKEDGTQETISRNDTYTILRSLFPEGRGGDQVWQKYFLTPCIINAYNAGSRTVGTCLHEFVESHTLEELQDIAGENPGYDLFTAFTYFARESGKSSSSRNYRRDAGTYFVSIVAASEVV